VVNFTNTTSDLILLQRKFTTFIKYNSFVAKEVVAKDLVGLNGC
jgi:hypothetical protein